MPQALRVAIIGPEASGKTELAKFLAATFGGAATEEYARRYFAERKLPADYALSAAEMREVMQGQRELEQGNGLLFIDASTIHGPLYAALTRKTGAMQFDYTAVDAEVMALAASAGYDAIIICYPHSKLGWVDDGMRSMPDLNDRAAFAHACEVFVAEHYADTTCMKVDAGSWPERELQAIENMKKLL